MAIDAVHALVEARLTVCNDAIHKDIEATLRFPLPESDATVCGFSVGPNRAISVPKAKAAEVAYTEREKGRAVATAANVSGATWETTVYPLPHNIPVEVTIQVVCGLSEDGAVALPLAFPSALTASATDDAGWCDKKRMARPCRGDTFSPDSDWDARARAFSTHALALSEVSAPHSQSEPDSGNHVSPPASAVLDK